MKEIVKDARAAEQKSVTRNLSKREIEWRWARERMKRGRDSLRTRKVKNMKNNVNEHN